MDSSEQTIARDHVAMAAAVCLMIASIVVTLVLRVEGLVVAGGNMVARDEAQRVLAPPCVCSKPTPLGHGLVYNNCPDEEDS